MMNQNNHSFFLFGGSFLAGVKPWLKEQGTVAGELMGISPISRLSAFGGALKPWVPELEAAMKQAGAEYFVLDLQCARQKLLISGGCRVSATTESLSLLTRKELALAAPELLPQEQAEEAIAQLAGAVRKRFAPDRIILLHTSLPDFWLAGNNLRTHQPAMFTAAQKKWLANLEQQFRDQTGCRYVDVSRFYFLQKEAGRPLTEDRFEAGCYRDVAGRVADILAGGTGRADRPDFGLSLDRYVAYHFTMQKKPQRVFLNAGYFLDNLILCAQPDFVSANREGLIALDALDWNSPEKALAMLRRLDPENPLTKICEAFHAVRSGRYDEPGVDYALLFGSGIAPEELIAYLKAEYAPKAGLLPGQINQYNAGWHLAKMLGRDPARYSTVLTVAEPTPVDVFGSCISRTMFNVQDNDFAVNRYWFHVPPYEYRNKAVECQPALFPEKLNWTDRLVRLQFEHSVYQDIQNSQAEWLVLDLYSLISPNTFLYQDCLYGDFDHRISNALKAKRVDLWRTPNVIAQTQDELLEALDPWLDILRKKYGSRIILMDGQRQDYWIGDDGRIYALPRKAECNEFMDRAFRYVQEKTDCYGIRIGQYFLPDELGYMRNTPAHKEDQCYFAAHDIARYIVDNMPQQKNFDSYPGQLQRLERLAENNPPAVLEQVMPLSELDKAVLRLGYGNMKKWHDALASIYEDVDRTVPLKTVLHRRGISPALAAALRASESAPVEEPPKLPSSYAEDPSASTCRLPKFPKVEMKRLANDGKSVVLEWSVPKNTTVRIFRWSRETGWTVLGKSVEKTFKDSTVLADTQYRYALGTEAGLDGVTFLGGFTAPKTIVTAIGVPALVSAVNISGINRICWLPVDGAEEYRIYRKMTQKDKWEVCTVIPATDDPCYSEPSALPEGGEWYTVRALRTVKNKKEAGGFQSGLPALPL